MLRLVNATVFFYLAMSTLDEERTLLARYGPIQRANSLGVVSFVGAVIICSQNASALFPC
jgi:hypothetical protein